MKLQIYQDQILRATISWSQSFCDEPDSYAKVWIDGHFKEDKQVWGVDPVQAFSLGMKLIEQLTENYRLTDGVQHTDWLIEVESNV